MELLDPVMMTGEISRKSSNCNRTRHKHQIRKEARWEKACFVLESDYLPCATLQNMSVNDTESLEIKGAEMRCSRQKMEKAEDMVSACCVVLEDETW
jgi:hypothetical protein